MFFYRRTKWLEHTRQLAKIVDISKIHAYVVIKSSKFVYKARYVPQ
jgi:hypothetical protein